MYIMYSKVADLRVISVCNFNDAYSHDTKHTLIPGFVVALKDRVSTPSIGTDPRATRQIGAFTWASMHALSALWRISHLADELLVADELFRRSKSKIVADKLFRTSKSLDQEKTLQL